MLKANLSGQLNELLDLTNNAYSYNTPNYIARNNTRHFFSINLNYLSRNTFVTTSGELHDLVKGRKPSILFLMETRV